MLVKWIVCEIRIDLSQRMRVMASCLAVASYFITLHIDIVTGAIANSIALTILAPHFIKSKAWDVVIMMMFLMSIGTGRLVTSGIR